jgi:NADH-quinone oxidoreductase subunit G
MSAQPAAPGVPPDHVTVEIDGRALVVPKSVTIIQVADQAGIAIPRFCYHDKLAIAANCRMCMVEVEMGGKPMAKPQPACATPVADGMKIRTQSAKALSAQRNVMEFLLINHPLDCPICDQGGECELQDLSVGYGRSVSRFTERKRTIPDEDLGSLVATEMTRCIQCTRCVRFMAEVAGTYELGGMERGERLQIGTYVGQPLMSELSGNVIDVCPVGALTNKPFRFKARAWELVARESIGYHDALGANLWLHTRRGEVLRAVPRDNEAINECWLSDRDRYSVDALRATDRATRPQVKRDGAWVEVDWNEAIRAASEVLSAASRGGIGALLHPATSSEEGHLVAKLVRALGSEHIDHRLRQLDFADGAGARAFEMPLADVGTADLIVLVGCNPRHEMPLLGARIRNAARHGAKIHAINPVDFDFDFEFALAGRKILAPAQMVDALLALARAASDAGHPPEPGALAGAIGAVQADAYGTELYKALHEARASLIVIGEAAQTHPQASSLRAAARFVARATGSACNEVPLGANALGLARVGALPGPGALDARAMLAQPRGAYLLYGCEPPQDFADGALALDALGAAHGVVAFSAFASETLRKVASVILPIGLLPEIDATLVNVHGSAQTVAPAARLPGDARPGWKVLRALGSALALDGFGFTGIAEVRAQAGLAASPSIGEDPSPNPMQRLETGFATELPSSLRAQGAAAAESTAPAGAAARLVRIATTSIYAADAVLRRSPALQAHPLASAPAVVLHPQDALAMGFADGANARVCGVVLPVRVSARVPRGGAWIEAGTERVATLPRYGAALDIEKA